jgi:hypothetical protein
MATTVPVTENAPEKPFTVGVDTHLDSHAAVAVVDLGRRLGEMHRPTNQADEQLTRRSARHRTGAPGRRAARPLHGEASA